MQIPDVRSWPGLELIRPLPGGSRNPAFLARRGDRMFVVRTSGRHAQSLDWELDLLNFLRACDIRVPQDVPTADGRRHVDGVLVQRFLSGHPPTSTSEWRRVIEVLNSVHELTRSWTQRPGFATSRDLLGQDDGGDIDLTILPPEAAAAIRASWRPVHEGGECVVHGDVSRGNVLVDGDAVALLDWDEARVDVPWFDFADVPLEVKLPAPCSRAALVTAGIAWEAATCWKLEPEYAAQRLAELYDRLGQAS